MFKTHCTTNRFLIHLQGNWIFWLGMLVFRLVLDMCYQHYMYPVFRWDTPVNFNYAVEIDRYLFSLLVFGLFASTMRARVRNMTDVFLFMAAVFLVAPMTCEYGLNAARSVEPVLTTAIALLLVELVSRAPLSKNFVAPPIASGATVAMALSVAGVIYLLAWGTLSGAVAYLNFDVKRIYEFRDKAAVLLDVGALAYLNLWVYKVFVIFLVCVLLQHKRFGWLILVLACQFFFFGLTSHRIVLFLPFLAIAFWLYLGRSDQLSPMPYAAAVGLLFALVLQRVWGIEAVAEISIRRTFFVPSSLIFQWFDFFDTHAHVYWTDKLLASFSNGDYARVNVPRLIGDYIVPDSNSAANTGLVASGYAHAGYWGVVLYAVILGLVLSVLNAFVSSGVPLWLVAALSIGPLRTAIADSDLFTALLSHGLGVVVLLLWFYRGQPQLSEKKTIGVD